jgi:hypothetical protein
MPEASQNSYKLDRRTIDFTLYEHLHIEQLFEGSKPRRRPSPRPTAARSTSPTAASRPHSERRTRRRRRAPGS